MIALQIAKPISIQLPYVYRYMDEKYIDMFFEEGKLRISSFKKFIEYPDEIRGDKSEGTGTYEAKTKEGLQFLSMTNVGSDAYMLCTSLIASEDLKRQFEVKSYFKIKNPVEFSAAVINAIPGLNQAFLGFCNYQDYRIVKKELQDFSTQEFTSEQGSLIIGNSQTQRSNEMIGNGIDLMFLKDKSYQSQAEFRFVWTINKQFYEMSEYVDILCKEAVQFCERINPS